MGGGGVWLLGLFFSPFHSDKITYVLKKLIGKRLIFVGGDCFVCSSCFYQKGKLTVNHRYLQILILMFLNKNSMITYFKTKTRNVTFEIKHI